MAPARTGVVGGAPPREASTPDANNGLLARAVDLGLQARLLPQPLFLQHADARGELALPQRRGLQLLAVALLVGLGRGEPGLGLGVLLLQRLQLGLDRADLLLEGLAGV